jgi:hypothetical protein
MPRALKKPKRPIGNPQKPIDWAIVDKYLEWGCNGTEIAPHFGICDDTLRDRCEQEKGILWSTYLAQKRSKGDSILRELQFKKAMQGSDTMLIWLGKVRLDQKEAANIVQVTPEHAAAFDALMNQFKQAQDDKS